MNFRDHTDSEYMLHVRIDHKVVEFIGNTLTHSLIYSAIYISTDNTNLIHKTEQVCPKFTN